MNKPTLFISSTVKDVQEVRASVKALLENKLGYHILMSEHEGSKPKTPIEQCRKWAKECDIFIAIIGHSYGWVIPHLGISVCEFEFNEAYKDNPEKILIYASATDKDERQTQFVNRLTGFSEGYYRRPPFNNETELLNGIRDDLAEYFKVTLDIIRSKKLKIRNRITPSREDYAILSRGNRIEVMMADAIEIASQLGFVQVKYEKPLFWSAEKSIKRIKVLFTFNVIPDNLTADWLHTINLRWDKYTKYGHDMVYQTYPNRVAIIFVHGTATISTLEKLTWISGGTCFKVEPGLYYGADLNAESKPHGKMRFENRIVLSKVTNKRVLGSKLSDVIQWINQEYSRINFKSNYEKPKAVKIKKWKH
jgi:hypothetical protein